MLKSSSSVYNETTLHPQMNNFLYSYIFCLVSRPSSIIFLMLAIISICLHLSLSVLILHHALQQWTKCSNSSSAPTSHSDCFTYHLACLELIAVIGYVLIVCVICNGRTPGLLEIGALLVSYTWFGEEFFHILMSVDRYLAVVHPIIYLNLRNERWIRIRNAVLGFIWLLCLLGIALMIVNFFIITHFCMLIFSVAVVSFCNFSVLKVLRRSGPGEQGGGRERADQSKQRAFHTILVILGVLVLRFAWGLFWVVLCLSGGSSNCVTMTTDVWFNLPGGLVVPLLFVLRKGKCACCKKNIQ